MHSQSWPNKKKKVSSLFAMFMSLKDLFCYADRHILPETKENWPAWQGVGLADPVGQKCPTGHSSPTPL